MKRVLDSRCIDVGQSWPEVAQAAVNAGFDAVELPVSDAGPLTPDTGREDCHAIAKSLRDAGVSIVALRAAWSDGVNLTSVDPVTRREAEDRTRRLLHRAEWLGASVVNVPVECPTGPASGRSSLGLADAQHVIFETLVRLAGEAEVAGATVGLEAPCGGFPANAIHAAELSDRVNSPWVGICLNREVCASAATASEWIRESGWRLAAIRIGNARNEYGESALATLDMQLNEVAFTGPVLSGAGVETRCSSRHTHG